MEKIIVANHKMNMLLPDILKYVSNFEGKSDGFVFCPSALYVPYFISKGLTVGLQNIYTLNSGAYTGEISASQAKSVGADYVIVGHSERREIFKETDLEINQKVKLALANDLRVILCVGEKAMDDYKEVIKKQLLIGLEGVSKPIIVSYEPVWAIGSNKKPSVSLIVEVVNYIKSFFDYDVPVLYGGSVDFECADKLRNVSELSGFMVGSASISAEELIKIKEVL